VRRVLKVPSVLRVLVPRVLVVLMVPGAALAQDGGVIAGRVVDGVTTFTDDRGAYRFGDLVPADYLGATPLTIAGTEQKAVDLRPR
jgi:hypothetical protein